MTTSWTTPRTGSGDGLSIGADLYDVTEQAGMLVVRGGVVREVSLVGMPAYAAARLE